MKHDSRIHCLKETWAGELVKGEKEMCVFSGARMLDIVSVAMQIRCEGQPCQAGTSPGQKLNV